MSKKTTVIRIRQAERILEELGDSKKLILFEYFWNAFLADVRDNLEKEEENIENTFYIRVKAMFEDAGWSNIVLTGCYFCDGLIDANEQEFNLTDCNLCLTCRIKIANLLQFVNVDPEILFPGIPKRSIQKSNIGDYHVHKPQEND